MPRIASRRLIRQTNPRKPYLAGKVIVADVAGDARGDGRHIEAGQLGDKRDLVHQERERLADATSGTQNGNLHRKHCVSTFVTVHDA